MENLMYSRNYLPVALAVVVLLLVNMACNLTPRSEPTPAEVIPITTEAVESLKKDLQKAGKEIKLSGQTTLVIDEAELTSLAAFELQNQDSQVFQDPQIFLRDGQIKIATQVEQGNSRASVDIVMEVSADADGRPEYQLVSAKIGPLPLPESMSQQIYKLIDDAFTSKIDPQMDDIFIDNITIKNGLMTVQGHLR